MFSSVHRCTGDLTCEVLILTCFGNLPPDRQVYLGMRTMIVKETIRGRGRRIGVSALGRVGRRIGVSALGRIGVGRRGETYRRVGVGASAWEETYRPWGVWAYAGGPGISKRPAPIRRYVSPNADPPTRPSPTRFPNPLLPVSSIPLYFTRCLASSGFPFGSNRF
jgi:hypothetical protein